MPTAGASPPRTQIRRRTGDSGHSAGSFAKLGLFGLKIVPRQMSALGCSSLESFSQTILTISKNEGKAQCFAQILKINNSVKLLRERGASVLWRKSMKFGPAVEKYRLPLPGNFV